jgi:hypothetical protein
MPSNIYTVLEGKPKNDQIESDRELLMNRINKVSANHTLPGEMYLDIVKEVNEFFDNKKK